MRTRVIAAVLLAAALATPPADAARVVGRASGGPAPVDPKGVDLYGKFRRNARPADAPAPNPLIIALQPLGTSAPPAPGGQRAIMDQRNEQFTPRALAVQAGTTVDFVNSDEFYHNVFSLSALQKFNLGRYRKGVARSVVFEKPGLVKLFCEIHPRMIGYILVLETPWHGAATPAGDYVLPDVPPGRYTVIVWHERLKAPVEFTTLDVTDAAEQRFDFTVPSGP